MKKSKHIIFNKDIQSKIVKSQSSKHQTWNINTDAQTFKFGGKVANEINLLIEFDVVPSYLSWLNVDKLQLGMDFELFFNSLLNNKILSYEHSKGGSINLLTNNIEITVPYSNYPLKETEIRIADTPTELYSQEWEGNTNKLNSTPIWVQEEEILTCPKCQNRMEFLIQLTSGLPDLNEKNNFEIMFGNDGELYGFWCNKDLISSYIWQST